MSIVPALALAVFVYLAYRAVMELRPVLLRPGAEIDDAIAVTRQRLVRGEIDRSDFERIVSILTS